MIYTTPDNHNLIKDKDRFLQSFWGQILTPSSYATAPKASLWCADNEAFTRRFKVWRFFRWLWKMRPHRKSCLFVAVPDVVGDARKTLWRYLIFAPLIKLLGYRAAFVAQDGQESLWFPPFDTLFVGGSTGWKLSEKADCCIRVAKQRGAWVHVGRVNSQKRMRHFKLVGVNSVDGTSLTYAPGRDFWRFQKALLQPTLFTLETET